MGHALHISIFYIFDVMMTLTTQQNILRAAQESDASWNRAVVFATYQPALYLDMISTQKVGKRSSYVDEISLDDILNEPVKKSSKLISLKKSKSKKSANATLKKRENKKRVIRAKKSTKSKKKKKATTATVVPVDSVSKETRRVGKTSSFTSWLKSTKGEQTKKEKKQQLKRKIKKSTKRNDMLVTEPIAEQLVRQGYKAKAIKMYEQLLSIIPDKSDHYTAIIEKLRREL